MEYSSIHSNHETLDLAVESRMSCLDNWIVKELLLVKRFFFIPVFLEFILKLQFKTSF